MVGVPNRHLAGRLDQTSARGDGLGPPIPLEVGQDCSLQRLHAQQVGIRRVSQRDG